MVVVVSVVVTDGVCTVVSTVVSSGYVETVVDDVIGVSVVTSATLTVLLLGTMFTFVFVHGLGMQKAECRRQN